MWLWKKSNVVMNLQIHSAVYSGSKREHETLGYLNTPFWTIQQITLKNPNGYFCASCKDIYYAVGTSHNTLLHCQLSGDWLCSHSVQSTAVAMPISPCMAKWQHIRDEYLECYGREGGGLEFLHHSPPIVRGNKKGIQCLRGITGLACSWGI
jgi:hypothetical protein